MEAIAGDRWPESRHRPVQTADQLCRAAQRHFGLRIGRKAMPVPRLPARVIGDVAVDEGQHFPVVLDTQHPGRSVEPGCFQVAQYSCTAGDHGPIGRSSRSPRRTIPLVMRPPEIATLADCGCEQTTKPVSQGRVEYRLGRPVCAAGQPACTQVSHHDGCPTVTLSTRR